MRVCFPFVAKCLECCVLGESRRRGARPVGGFVSSGESSRTLVATLE